MKNQITNTIIKTAGEKHLNNTKQENKLWMTTQVILKLMDERRRMTNQQKCIKT